MEFESEFEKNLFELRQEKLKEIEKLGQAVYPNRFPAKQGEVAISLAEVRAKWDKSTGEELEATRINVTVAGRIMAIRAQGKAGFATLQQEGQRLQIYVRKDAVGDAAFELYKLLDLGDHIGVTGYLFRTRTNELTIHVETISFLAKALLALPEKYHGLADVELRYRQRYVDLFMNSLLNEAPAEGATEAQKAGEIHVRDVFIKRAQVLRAIRKFFDTRGYIEVETPMMQSIAGGAMARPFVTHHNALDIDLFLRIAPELYLKRLVVGGFDRVYEINRNFRNEGISTQHNPEFTMLEFYEAYSNYRDLMKMNEELFSLLAMSITGSTLVKYGEHELDFAKMQKLTMREAIVKYWPAVAGAAPTEAELAAPGGPGAVVERYNTWAKAAGAPYAASKGVLKDGEWTGLLFETMAEDKLVQPTILYDFPTDISPLSKQKPEDPSLTERFEIYVAGMEVANGFSELNDPAEQERRFLAQIALGGEEVPKQLDVDYIRALCHGMPPTAGEGIGIDRLTMLLTDSQSIRDVILFPLLRPEPRQDSGTEADGV